ncbi:MAG: methionine--tRNA ligase [bacterium]|nr:methionine--tRNA ligase [bacterium]
MNNKKYYITTPIYYPSANFHIGHCYTTIIADSIARFKRLQGYDVFFLTGSDEHGLKIENKAKEKGVTPKEYVDEIVENAKDLWKSLNISYDKFIRTTDDYHVATVKKIFSKLYEQGDIYLGEYEGMYCTPCESYWTKSQLVDGKCPDCGREVSLVKEQSYFFRLSKYEERIKKLFEEQKDFILPESRKNEMVNNFLNKGLEDLCVSRTTFSWGIPVDFDPKHVIYVWIDALTNYITALGYLSDDDSNFKKYWPADLHLVGKEIVRFHTIIWPALLMALDLPLPKGVFGHGWLKINGDKISKSLGNYKDPREYINTYGVDAVRYFALREVPLGSDGNFSEEALKQRTNTDLANTLGNLLNRTISMSEKYFDGIIKNPNKNDEPSKQLIDDVNTLKQKVEANMEQLDVSNALDNIFDILRKCNKYIDVEMPWILAKEEKYEELETVLYNILESIRICSIFLKCFMPETADNIFRQLNTDKTTYDTLYFGCLENNHKLGQKEILFNRID